MNFVNKIKAFSLNQNLYMTQIYIFSVFGVVVDVYVHRIHFIYVLSGAFFGFL